MDKSYQGQIRNPYGPETDPAGRDFNSKQYGSGFKYKNDFHSNTVLTKGIIFNRYPLLENP